MILCNVNKIFNTQICLKNFVIMPLNLVYLVILCGYCGYTKYILINNKLELNNNTAYLKICCFKFENNKERNKLNIDLTTVKFQSIDINTDFLNGIDEFVQSLSVFINPIIGSIRKAHVVF